ncbi:hypothetical protein [Frigoribacterium salinisoli]
MVRPSQPPVDVLAPWWPNEGGTATWRRRVGTHPFGGRPARAPGTRVGDRTDPPPAAPLRPRAARTRALARISFGLTVAATTAATLTSCGLVDRSDPESQEAAAYLDEACGTDLTGEEYEGVAYGAFSFTTEIDGEEVDVKICDPDVPPTEVVLCTNDDQDPTPIPVPSD